MNSEVEPSIAHRESYPYFSAPGNANLPIGGLRHANREIGAPNDGAMFSRFLQRDKSRNDRAGISCRE